MYRTATIDPSSSMRAQANLTLQQASAVEVASRRQRLSTAVLHRNVHERGSQWRSPALLLPSSPFASQQQQEPVRFNSMADDLSTDSENDDEEDEEFETTHEQSNRPFCTLSSEAADSTPQASFFNHEFLFEQEMHHVDESLPMTSGNSNNNKDVEIARLRAALHRCQQAVTDIAANASLKVEKLELEAISWRQRFEESQAAALFLQNRREQHSNQLLEHNNTPPPPTAPTDTHANLFRIESSIPTPGFSKYDRCLWEEFQRLSDENFRYQQMLLRRCPTCHKRTSLNTLRRQVFLNNNEKMEHDFTTSCHDDCPSQHHAREDSQHQSEAVHSPARPTKLKRSAQQLLQQMKHQAIPTCWRNRISLDKASALSQSLSPLAKEQTLPSTPEKSESYEALPSGRGGTSNTISRTYYIHQSSKKSLSQHLNRGKYSEAYSTSCKSPRTPASSSSCTSQQTLATDTSCSMSMDSAYHSDGLPSLELAERSLSH